MPEHNSRFEMVVIRFNGGYQVVIQDAIIWRYCGEDSMDITQYGQNLCSFIAQRSCIQWSRQSDNGKILYLTMKD